MHEIVINMWKFPTLHPLPIPLTEFLGKSKMCTIKTVFRKKNKKQNYGYIFATKTVFRTKNKKQNYGYILTLYIVNYIPPQKKCKK